MIRFMAWRVVNGIGTLFGLSTIVFVVLLAIPGNVTQTILGVEGASSPELALRLEREFGLDRPIYVQFFSWVGNVLRADLGTSWRTAEPVMDTILDRLPLTAEIALFSIIIALLVGIPLGVIGARNQDRLLDHITRGISLLGAAIPPYISATLILLVGSMWLGWVPPTGYTSLFEDPLRNLSTVITPALVLGLTSAAGITRMTRGAMLDELSRDYVRTAYSKGLHQLSITNRHALRNASIPVLTVVGIEIGTLLGGTVITEAVFSLPGLGRLVVDAIAQRDYPMVQGAVLVIAAIYVTINFLTDLVYGIIDPRVRTMRTKS
ncbi:ABC transporter permease [Candidatus Poriferisodalis sp.]|uniref:ABC transporter permease n=1 Tax=Candidatus Poriferisodalis sp. TaxID=3101277 RepID=UPI003AF98916